MKAILRLKYQSLGSLPFKKADSHASTVCSFIPGSSHAHGAAGVSAVVCRRRRSGFFQWTSLPPRWAIARRTRDDGDGCSITAEDVLHGGSEWRSLSDDSRRRELES